MARDEDLQHLRRRMAGSRWAWVDRPTLLHGRASGAGQCPCGCESWSGDDPRDWAATLLEKIPGPEMLIDRWTGRRWVRSDQLEEDDSLQSFDEIKVSEHCDRIYMPRRAYAKQLAAIDARPKLKGYFGSVRGGKTASLSEEFGDVWFEACGPGIHIWWVAPQLADTMRAVRKLVTGEAIVGGKRSETRPPLFDPRLVLSYPTTLEQVKRRVPICLVDGTVIELRYAGRGEKADAGNLKGDPTPFIGVDEGAEIMNAEAWQNMIDRTVDSGGRISVPTTPKMGSPLKAFVYDDGIDISANSMDYSDEPTAYVHLVMADNPWITARKLDLEERTTKKQANGEDLWKQNGLGQWIVPGHRMWEHLDEDRHFVEGPWRNVESYEVDGRKLVNITPRAAAAFFQGTESDLTRVAGQDFNVRNHFTVPIQVAVREGDDASDHRNWIVFVEDEYRKNGEPHVAARFLANQAAHVRGLPASHFKGMAIACDPNGAHPRVPESQTGNVITAYSDADAFVRYGFDMRPCHTTEKGKPATPGKVDNCAILHMLMRAQTEAGRPSTRLLISRPHAPWLIKGLREQVSDDRGRPMGTTTGKTWYQDRLSDPVDALLYILWALFAEHEFYEPAEVVWR